MRSDLSNIKLMLLDVDGVLTDGKIIYADSGEEIKSFCSKDGFGIKLLIDSGVKVGIVTGRTANGALNARCKNLGIELVFDGIKDKISVLQQIVESKIVFQNSEIAFVGDDLPDIQIMKLCGFSFAVADAAPEVIKIADYTTKNRGGEGAVREICEKILKAKALWEDILKLWI